jgi:DNA polymerase-3 subunit delta
MLYILHGEDEFTRSEQLAGWRARLGEPTTSSLNTIVLDGRKVTLPELVQACDALPLLGRRRLVIVEDFWSRFEPPERGRARGRPRKMSAADAAFVEALLEYLPRVPETTRLVFVEGRSLSRANPVFDLLPADEKRVHIKEFRPPAERNLGPWIRRRMEAKGGTITAPAARQLASLVGNDLRQLDGELEKLLAYANYQRPVTVDDVHSLVSTKHLVDVFDLVDAMGLRRGEAAMRHLHELLDAGAAPLYLLHMIVRQFRILLSVKELLSKGATPSQIQRELGIKHKFIVEKASRQAHHFSMARLESIYAHLADVEQDIKTGQIEDLLALDVLVAELCA